MITEIIPALFIGNVADAQDARTLHEHERLGYGRERQERENRHHQRADRR